MQCSHSNQIAADESVLQMATRPALVELSRFLLQPNSTNASRLVCIPTLHDVVRYEASRLNGKYPSTVLGVCKWVYERAREVLSMQTVDDLPPAFQGPADEAYEDWRTVMSSNFVES